MALMTLRRFCAAAMAVALLIAACSGGGKQTATSAPTNAPALKAVVLGGGGLTGQAWEGGLLAGLRDLGIDLSTADLFVGTSSGAFIASRIASGTSTETIYGQLSFGGGPSPLGQLASDDLAYLQETTRLYCLDFTLGFCESVRDNTAALRAEVGARALLTPHPIPESQALQRVRLLALGAWPQQRLKITAVDVADGTVKFFDGSDGITLDVAVAASSAVPGRNAPITAGAHRYMDGGVAGTNIDAASGYRVVVAITPFPAGKKTDQEIGAVRARGGSVLQFVPDEQSRFAMGTDALDGTRQRMAAEAGNHQAAGVAAALRAFWEHGAPKT